MTILKTENFHLLTKIPENVTAITFVGDFILHLLSHLWEMYYVHGITTLKT